MDDSSIKGQNDPDLDLGLLDDDPTDSVIECGPQILKKTHGKATGKNHTHVSIPLSDWIGMKKQNEKILALLQKEPDSGDDRRSVRSKKRKRVSDYESDDECDVDEEIDDLMNLGDSKEGNSSSETDELELIQHDFENDEDVGEIINDKLAKVLDTMSKGKITEEKMKEKLSAHKRPSNCDFCVPRVNAEIWGVMDHSAKSVDCKAQKTQKQLMTATYVLATVADTCTKSSSVETKTLMKPILEAAGLVLKTIHDLSLDRRNRILNSQSLNRKYKKLASSEIPITNNLFGDDLKGAFAQIDTTSKLGQSFTVSSKGNKFFPTRAKNYQDSWYENNSHQNFRKGPYQTWRGRGKRPFQRGRGRFTHKTGHDTA
ncbi:uncharacterized protein [Littorina saxatilis]|uniref:uncharacterized protein n=1 Tax=Littorina saxatilis TaxID=31220 RepID=UPI0038B50510